MRIPFTSIEITTRRAIAAEVNVAAKALAEEGAADIAKRYAHNPQCLRAATAAYLGLSSNRFIADDSMTLPLMTRAIEAFADTMLTERAQPVTGRAGR